MDQQSVPALVPTSLKDSKFPKLTKKSIIFILAVAILILLIPLILLSSKKQTPPQPETPQAKTWEIILNYDSKADSLSLKKLSVLNQEINADFRSAMYSPYELVVQDKEERALFRTKVNITEQIIYNFPYEPESSGSALPARIPQLETILYIPFRASATKILINKDYSPILQINIPPEIAFNLIPEVLAQTTPQSCGGMQVIFISDNYSDPNQFHQDVEQLKTIFNSTEPYASANPKIFDFRELYNTTSLGCINGILPDPQKGRFTGCSQNRQIQQIGRSRFPGASKFIVVVNNPNAQAVDGSLLGATNDIGGDVAVFTNRQDGVPKFPVAAHEFLGHSVGLLYDRYVAKDPSYGPLSNNIRSNCTDNSNGEAFWRTAGGQGVFPGCSNPTYYGSSSLSCPIYNSFSNFQNGGSQSSLMSLYGCGGNTFDSVEQTWINQRVIPLYQTACPVSPTPATQPTATPRSTPGSTATRPIPTQPPIPTSNIILNNTGNYPIAKFTFPGERRWLTTYAGITARFQATAQAPAGKTLTSLGIYRVPANIYATSSENWIPVDTEECNSATCNITGNWTTTQSDRQTWQDWYLNVIAEDSSGVKCSGQILYPTAGLYYPCGGGILAIQILPGIPSEGYVFGSGTFTPFTGADTQTNPTPSMTSTTPPSSTTSKTYVCEEVVITGGSGSQVQLKTLQCH